MNSLQLLPPTRLALLSLIALLGPTLVSPALAQVRSAAPLVTPAPPALAAAPAPAVTPAPATAQTPTPAEPSAPAATPPVATTPAAPPAPVAAPAAPPAPVAAPAAPPAGEPAPAATAPTPPVAPAAATAPPACPPEGCLLREGDVLWFGGDLLPYLGTSSAARGQEVRRISLNLLAGLTGGVDGIELAHGANIDLAFMRGAQFAGGANVVLGPVSGAQFSGGGNFARGDVLGAQFAGGLNLGFAAVTGAQFAGGANVQLGGLHGGQFAGGVNVVKGGVDGAQFAGGLNVALGQVDGAQFAGGLNLAGSVDGLQLAPLDVSLGDVQGLQLGVVNIAETADAQLGVVNVAWRGRWNADVWSDDTGFVRLGLKNGARYTHTMYWVGLRKGEDETRWSTGLGFGGHLAVNERLWVDLDLLSETVRGEDWDADDLSMLNTLRLIAGFQVTPGVRLFAGPAVHVTVADKLRGDDLTFLSTDNLHRADGDEPRVDIWPGFVAGLELF